jgi:magnesium-transporting ATPase (P-type)
MTTALVANEARLRVIEADGDARRLEMVGDTVDVALLALGAKLGLDRADLAKPDARVPYEPALKFAAAFVRDPDAARWTAHVKGAVETVVAMCAHARPAEVEAAAEALAAQGYRVLAFAAGPVERPDREALAGLEFLGLVGLIDPLRPAAVPAVAQCTRAGIRVVMVTGDHPVTALAIARELGLADAATQVMTGRELAGLAARGADLAAEIAEIRVFARVEPLQKLAIVEALQRSGGVVAVTGDGVNDALALRQADVGVAMGKGGTDVARGAADLIVTDDDFASIVSGIEEGRVAHDNLRKIVLMQLSTGAAEIMIFAVALMAGLPLPLFAVQLLWLNMVTNGVQDVALAFERGEPDVLARPPRPPGGALIDRGLLEAIAVYGLAFGLTAYVVFEGLMGLGHGEFEARSALLVMMVAFENVLVLACRSERRSLFAVPMRDNPFVVAAVAGTFLLHLAVMHVPAAAEVLRTGPISGEAWCWVVAGTLAAIVVSEGYKALRRRYAAPLEGGDRP